MALDQHVLKRTPTEVRRALAYVLLNARKHYRQRRRRTPSVVLDGASSGLWFDGWKGRDPPPGHYADADRAAEVAAPRTWLLSKGWRRIGFVDPAEVPADDVDSPNHGPWVTSARARLPQSERLHTLPLTGIGGPRARGFGLVVFVLLWRRRSARGPRLTAVHLCS